MERSYGELAEAIVERFAGPAPHLVGVGGPVAVGKSTVAQELSVTLGERGRTSSVVSTDAFLYPNEVLSARGIAFRKGFPESFDLEGLGEFARGLKSGADHIEIPVYSHKVYDVVPQERAVVASADVVIIEGVVALQAPLVDELDVGIYVDAEEPVVRGWFVERFLAFTEAARSDTASFYARFAEMSPDQLRALAEGTWDAINGVNLRENIRPSRGRATLVVRKAADHSVAALVRTSA